MPALIPSLLDPKPTFKQMKMSDGASYRLAIWQPETHNIQGSVLFLNGRSEFIEKYETTMHDFVKRGYQVLTFDWRGQGLSERAPDIGTKGYIEDFATYQSDLAEIITTEFIPLHTANSRGKPTYLVAHSMGANIALNHLLAEAKSPKEIQKKFGFDGAILSAPMTRIMTGPFPQMIAEAIADFMCLIGKGKSYAYRQQDFGPKNLIFDNNPYTKDKGKFEKFHSWLQHNPKLICSGASWGWLSAAFNAMNSLRTPDYLKEIKTDILLLSPLEDRVVDSRDHAKLAAQLPNCKLCQFKDAEHELFLETPQIEQTLWAEIDSFLKKNPKFSLKNTKSKKKRFLNDFKI